MAQQLTPKLLSLAVASACAVLAAPVHAQQSSGPAAKTAPQTPKATPASKAAATPTAAEEPAQTVVVTGFRSSLEKALDYKRAEVGQRDSIVAEDIGKFPEQNIADALVRLPGVEVVKDVASNEGQRIQLRGLGSEYTVTTFNGAPVRATSAGAIGGSSRDFNYDVFPSELFGRADVYKTPLASLEEGGVAGVVDLQTPRPFDRKGRVLSYSIASTHNTKSGKNSPRANALFSNTWGKVGFLVAVAKNETNNANAGFQSTGTYASYNQRFTSGNFPYAWNLADPSANIGSLTTAQLFDANMPRFFRITSTDNVRNRLGIASSLQYKGDQLDISWDTLSSNLKDDTKSNYMNFIINGSTGARALIPMGVTVDANNNVQGQVGNVTMSTNAVTGKSETDFKYNAINAKYKITNDLRLSGQIAANRSVAWRNDATVTADASAAAYRHTITFDTSKDAMFPDLSTNRDLLDPTIYNLVTYSGSYRTETDKQKNARLVLDYNYRFLNVDAKLKVGLSNVESTKIARSFLSPNLLDAQTIPGVGLYSTATAAQKTAYGRSLLVENDQADIKMGGGALPRNWLTIDRNYIYGTLDSVNANRNAPANLGGTFKAVEDIKTLFVQSDFEHELFGRTLRSNVGVRYVRTGTDIDNYTLVAGVQQPTHLEGSYSNVLPSISAAYDLTEDLVWRLSGGKTIKRSSISLIARSYSVPNGGDLIIQAGNPDLKPESSKNFDTSLEWYFGKGNILAASAFRKNIAGRPLAGSEFVPFESLGLSRLLFTSNLQETLAATPGTPVELRLFKNAEAFRIEGLEVAYQQSYKFLPKPFNNFGSIISLTNIKTAGVTRTYNNIVYELPIVPENTVAATLFYEDGPFSVRTSYNHKSAFANFNNTGVNPLGYQRWYNARGYLDASIGYKFNKYVELRLDASNLTNTRTYETLRHFEGRNGDQESRLEGANQSGRNISLSLRGSL